jgi:opacity protein-like surface antigen
MSQTVSLGDYGTFNVPLAINQFNFDILGKYVFDINDEFKPIVVGRLGYSHFASLIDSVISSNNELLYLASYRTNSPTLGIETTIPFYTHYAGLHARFVYWLFPSTTETPTGSTGTDISSSAYNYQFGIYVEPFKNFVIDLSLEQNKFNYTFTGSGVRFTETVTNATATDSFMRYSLGLEYQF